MLRNFSQFSLSTFFKKFTKISISSTKRFFFSKISRFFFLLEIKLEFKRIFRFPTLRAIHTQLSSLNEARKANEKGKNYSRLKIFLFLLFDSLSERTASAITAQQLYLWIWNSFSLVSFSSTLDLLSWFIFYCKLATLIERIEIVFWVSGFFTLRIWRIFVILILFLILWLNFAYFMNFRVILSNFVITALIEIIAAIYRNYRNIYNKNYYSKCYSRKLQYNNYSKNLQYNNYSKKATI